MSDIDQLDQLQNKEEDLIADAPSDEQGGGEAVLNQDEIDSLLGFDGGDVDGDGSTGVMALVNSAMVNYERLPMLDIVFDRLVRLMATTFRNLTSDNVEVVLENIETVRFGDYMENVPEPSLLSVFHAREWENNGLIFADSSLIFSVVDVMLGGRRGGATMRPDNRPYTTIETKLVQKTLEVMLHDLSRAFDPLAIVNFEIDRMESSARFATITQVNNACVLAHLNLIIGDRGGRIDILIPYATLEPIRDLLLQMFMGEKFGRDTIWESHLTEQLLKTDVQLQAVLGSTTVSLQDMLNWEVGSQVFFSTEVDDDIELRVGETAMFQGPVGQKMGALAVQVERYIQKKKRKGGDT